MFTSRPCGGVVAPGTTVAPITGVHQFPHRYRVSTTASPAGPIAVESGDLPPVATTTPPEFDGPAGWWSPETLLVAAVVDCFALTFRGIARSGKLPWTSLTADCVGTLERPNRVTQFTRFDLHVQLTLPPHADEDQARRALVRAEETCLITRSMKAETQLAIEIHRGAEVAA